MTEVNFSLRDFAGVAWDAGTVPVVTFRASRPAVSLYGSHAGEVVASPATDGSVVVDLTATESMLGAVSYSMELSWVEDRQSRRAFWDYRFKVPESLTAIPLMDLVEGSPLGEVVEFSEGTTDLAGRPLPHSSKTTLWFRNEGGQYRHMLRSEA